MVLPASFPPAQFKLLNHLAYTTNIDETPSQLAVNSHVSLSAMSQIIKQLLGKGYVSLRPFERDSRKKAVCITDEGRHAHDRAIAQVGSSVAPLSTRFSTRDLAQLHELLHSFRCQFEEVAPAHGEGRAR